MVKVFVLDLLLISAVFIQANTIYALDSVIPQVYTSVAPIVSTPIGDLEPDVTIVPTVSASPLTTETVLPTIISTSQPVSSASAPIEIEKVSQISGDINKNKVVDIQDYSLLKSEFGTINKEADINSDGLVNILDYVILSNNFNKNS